MHWAQATTDPGLLRGNAVTTITPYSSFRRRPESRAISVITKLYRDPHESGDPVL